MGSPEPRPDVAVAVAALRALRGDDAGELVAEAMDGQSWCRQCKAWVQTEYPQTDCDTPAEFCCVCGWPADEHCEVPDEGIAWAVASMLDLDAEPGTPEPRLDVAVAVAAVVGQGTPPSYDGDLSPFTLSLSADEGEIRGVLAVFGSVGYIGVTDPGGCPSRVHAAAELARAVADGRCRVPRSIARALDLDGGRPDIRLARNRSADAEPGTAEPAVGMVEFSGELGRALSEAIGVPLRRGVVSISSADLDAFERRLTTRGSPVLCGRGLMPDLASRLYDDIYRRRERGTPEPRGGASEVGALMFGARIPERGTVGGQFFLRYTVDDDEAAFDETDRQRIGDALIAAYGTAPNPGTPERERWEKWRARLVDGADRGGPRAFEAGETQREVADALIRRGDKALADARSRLEELRATLERGSRG